MKIVMEMGIRDFIAWGEGEITKDKIVECGKCEEFDNLIEELYPNGLTRTELNDMLWFKDEWIYESLGISQDKKLIGEVWGNLSEEQQERLLKNANPTEKEGECIIDLTEDLSVAGKVVVVDEESCIVVDEDAIIYNPFEGVL